MIHLPSDALARAFGVEVPMLKTDPGIQSVFPWFEGQIPLQPIQTSPEPFGDYFGDDIRNDSEPLWQR